MDIFRHRPLFLCCSVFLLATLAGFFLRSAGILMAVGGVLAVGAAALCLWRARRRSMISVCVIAAAALLALGGVARSHLWFHGGNAASLSALEGQTVTVTGVVTDRRGAGAYLTSYSVRLTSVYSLVSSS